MKTRSLTMLTAVCVVVVSLSIAAPASRAIAGPIAFMGLFDDAHFSWFIEELGPYQLFEVYVWVFSSDNGLICGEFDITYDDILILAGSFDNPGAMIPIVPDPDGMTVCFSECQTDWVWLKRLDFLTTSTAPGHVYPLPHPVSGMLQAFSCLEGNPAEPLVVFGPVFCVNDPVCHVAVDERSWGAIKAIYED